ncbi:MAG: FHA domain-containing protein [Armatimonadota bacterium]|nr:FHA domain-containing protein [bacterium]
MNETTNFDQNKTQMADTTQMVMQPQSNATQFAVNVNCPVCETPNPPSETYCIDCGFLLNAAPVALEDLPRPVDAGKLVTTDGTREFILKPGENTVGRENTDILLAHNTVSRRHAKIIVTDGHASVEDLGSTNGTFIDGGKIERGDLTDGADVTFGSMTLKYVAPLAPIEEAGKQASEEVIEESTAEFVEEEAVECVSESIEQPETVELEPAPAAFLVAKDGSLKFSIQPGVNTIGRRDGANTILIADAFISGRHADLSFDDGVFTITDVGSTNGTLVNGVKLEPNAPKEVRDGDEITIGQKVFRIEAA